MRPPSRVVESAVPVDDGSGSLNGSFDSTADRLTNSEDGQVSGRLGQRGAGIGGGGRVADAALANARRVREVQANVRDQTTLSFVGASAEPSVPAEAFMEDTEAEADEVAEPVRVVVGARRTRAVQPHSSGRRRERRPARVETVRPEATAAVKNSNRFRRASIPTGKMAEIDALLAKGKGRQR